MSSCPFCSCDPFHYVDNGVGMEAVAVTCCELGDVYFRGQRPAPEEVTLSWDEFEAIGGKLAHLAWLLTQMDNLVGAVRDYRRYLEKSINAGPLTNNPSKEAFLLRRLWSLTEEDSA